MAHLTEEQQWAVYFKHKELQNVSKTARSCCVSRKCVNSVVLRLSKKTCAKHARRRGPKPVISQQAAATAKQLLAENKAGGAQQVAKALKDQGLVPKQVHKSTIIRHARRAASAAREKLRVCRGAPLKGLTQATMQKRLAFARENHARSWAPVMFTDRKKFYLRYPGTSVRMVQWELVQHGSKQECGVYQPNKPQVVNVFTLESLSLA